MAAYARLLMRAAPPVGSHACSVFRDPRGPAFLIWTGARKAFLTRFLLVPLNGDEDSPEAWLIMGRQESAAGTSSPGIAATVSEILGYWKRSVEVSGGCNEISAHYPEVELKETGPWSGQEPGGSSFELSRF